MNYKKEKKKCGQGQMEDQGQKIFSWECDQNILNVFFKTKLKMHLGKQQSQWKKWSKKGHTIESLIPYKFIQNYFAKFLWNWAKSNWVHVHV